MGSYITQDNAIVARIKPQTVTADSETLSDAVDMKRWDRIVADVNFGDYATGNDGSVTAKLVGATTSGGTYSDITGKALTTATFTGSAQDDSMGRIELSAIELATILGASYRYVKLSVTPTNQNMTLSAQVTGHRPDYHPASDNDLAAVKEIIA